MNTTNVNQLWVRVRDDVEAMHLLQVASWTRWQKLLIGYLALLLLLSLSSVSLLLPLWQKNRDLEGEVASLTASLSPTKSAIASGPLLEISPCPMARYLSAFEFLEAGLEPEELLGFERETLETERITAEISTEFVDLSTMIGCFAGDDSWQLVRWQLRRGAKGVDYLPIANIELTLLDE